VSDAKYVNLEELAEHVGVKVSTVRQWVKRGFIPRNTYIKAGNTYRFCLADVINALRQEEQPKEQPKEQPEETPKESSEAPSIEAMLSELDDDI
jgi:excisionase family DNA binding protein